MVRTKYFRQGVLAAVLMLPFLLTACGGTSGAIDPPPADVEAKMMAAARGEGGAADRAVNPTDAAQQKANMTVYAQDRHGYLAPISYQWSSEDPAVVAQASLEMLVKDGVHQGMLPPGFTATLPKGTSLKVTLKPEQKTALVELSKEFASYDKNDERKVMESIAWTLTSLPNVDQVQLWMDSKRLTEMPVDHTPMDTPLSRQIGINLEKDLSVNYLHSMPVTLYFSSYSEEGRAYFIPVTRLVEPSSDPVRTTLEQMIAGPLDKKSMNMVATKETEINDIAVEGDMLTVDLSDTMFEKGDQVPAELVKAVVLSLTERQGVKKVKLKINGDVDIQGTDKINYSEPVSRPVVNMAWKG
ncbi:GerMN domain-containing protein [Paenibacillus alvei]|uniref:GerMN domain-containing protein n=1 Tax=Paenibacillus alvei TaxID=44250 RepID=UPI0013DBE32D|nr:GerMN domain-containing protein [Paenibacillus alvei]MBG9734586.1 spore germination protein [Paenibacillus alvei]MBG9743103.1 spore germination protein [Paenibacillus alvei]MCY9579602.1 GerMN domain-containing protein [Paenibacillus alvei]MCY9586562.1 GerMN domain-containing protein [Paenibacillus alvei]NEZ43816.1 spore germination protein [Paenibacillus alvei]